MQTINEEYNIQLPMKPHSIFRNTVIGYKEGHPILFQNIAQGAPMNLFEVGWRETCQGEAFIDNITNVVLKKIEPNEATKYMYEYFKKNVYNENEDINSNPIVAFEIYMKTIIPKIYRGNFHKSTWNDYVVSFIRDELDEFA